MPSHGTRTHTLSYNVMYNKLMSPMLEHEYGMESTPADPASLTSRLYSDIKIYIYIYTHTHRGELKDQCSMTSVSPSAPAVANIIV